MPYMRSSLSLPACGIDEWWELVLLNQDITVQPIPGSLFYFSLFYFILIEKRCFMRWPSTHDLYHVSQYDFDSMRNHITHRTVFSENTQEQQWCIPQPSEQLIIRVWKWCNFRCIFCNVAENESVLSLQSSVKEILAITFYKLKYSKIVWNHINITISWGEPSIFQKETIFILKYFRTYFDKRWVRVSFDIQSNASNIDISFAHQLKKLWVIQALVSSHAHESEVFQDIIGVKYSIMGPKFEHGVSCLIEAGIPITFNSVINKINLHHFFDHIAYLHQKYPTVVLFNIGCVQPHGMASTNFDRLITDYRDILPVYARVIGYLTSHNKMVHSHLVGPPLCYMPDWSNSMEYMYNKSLIGWSSQNHTLIQSINDDNKKQVSACVNCRAKRVCSGIWKEFEWKQIVNPIVYDLFFQKQKKDTLVCDVSDSFISWKKSYDSWERQFFLYYDDIKPHQFLDAFAYIRTFWYSWITVVIKETHMIGQNYSEIAGINIQILYSAVRWLALDEIRKYNASVSFQFRIHVDIIVDNIQLTNDDIVTMRSLCYDGNIVLRVPKRWRRYFYGREFIYYFGSLLWK